MEEGKLKKIMKKIKLTVHNEPKLSHSYFCFSCPEFFFFISEEEEEESEEEGGEDPALDSLSQAIAFQVGTVLDIYLDMLLLRKQRGFGVTEK